MTVDRGAGYPVYTLASAGEPRPGRVVYFHGGAYIGEIASFQWPLAADLVRRTGSRSSSRSIR